MTTFTTITKFAGQTPKAYNAAGLTYNQASYLYNGILGTAWTNQTEN